MCCRGNAAEGQIAFYEEQGLQERALGGSQEMVAASPGSCWVVLSQLLPFLTSVFSAVKWS